MLGFYHHLLRQLISSRPLIKLGYNFFCFMIYEPEKHTFRNNFEMEMLKTVRSNFRPDFWASDNRFEIFFLDKITRLLFFFFFYLDKMIVQKLNLIQMILKYAVFDRSMGLVKTGYRATNKISESSENGPKHNYYTSLTNKAFPSKNKPPPPIHPAIPVDRNCLRRISY